MPSKVLVVENPIVDSVSYPFRSFLTVSRQIGRTWYALFFRKHCLVFAPGVDLRPLLGLADETTRVWIRYRVL